MYVCRGIDEAPGVILLRAQQNALLCFSTKNYCPLCETLCTAKQVLQLL
jgi:hypothetical protein